MGVRLLVIGGSMGLGLALAGCSAPPASEDTTTTSVVTTGEATTTTVGAEPVLVSEDLTDFQPRGATFANVEYTVTAVKISNQDLRSYARGGEPVIDRNRFHAFLDITAINRMTTTMTERFDPGHYKLIVDGSTIDAADEVGFLSDLAGFIRPNSGVESFLAFRVPEGTDLTGAVLTIGRPPQRRAQLPLTGEVPVNPYPIQLALEGTAEGDGPTSPTSRIRFELLGVTLAEDVPHEQATSPTGHRANEDDLFVVVHLLAVNLQGGPDLLSGNAFRLIIDGVPRAPWDSARQQGGGPPPTLERGAAVDVWVAFLVPVAATEFVLQVGDFSRDFGLIPLDLVSLP